MLSSVDVVASGAPVTACQAASSWSDWLSSHASHDVKRSQRQRTSGFASPAGWLSEADDRNDHHGVGFFYQPTGGGTEGFFS